MDTRRSGRTSAMILLAMPFAIVACARQALPSEDPDPPSWFAGEVDRTTPAPSRDFPASPHAEASASGDAEEMALRVLVVDDNEGFLAAARGLLERGGIAVVGVAKTGAEALQAARRLGPDVSLVDIDLGAESGFDVARRFDEAGLRSSVIMISTHDEGDFTELIADSPALGFLQKSRLSAVAIENLVARTGSGDGR